jgi:hypothetical protein
VFNTVNPPSQIMHQHTKNCAMSVQRKNYKVCGG